MKILLALIIILLGGQVLNAQYYYNDVAGTEETNLQMKNYNANKVRAVSATGYDANGVKATDFSEYREMKENGKAMKVTTINNFNKTVIYSRFDELGRVRTMTDSSTDIISTTSYEYNSAGKVSMVQNSTRDSANDFSQTETHRWIYNTAGKPEKMWRIINDGNADDTLEIRFATDEDGNTSEERSFKKGIETSYLYYYYDDKNRLTDIVRYNTKYKKLMPDIMFEYDEANNVAQKITTTSSFHLGYLIWRYVYDNRGLRTQEVLFNSDKVITGKIKYNYTF